MSDGEGHPVLDESWLALEHCQSRCNMVCVVSHLDVQAGRLPHQLNVVWFHSQCVLEALGCLSEVFGQFVDGAAGVPAEHALHATLHQPQFGELQRFSFLVQRL